MTLRFFLVVSWSFEKNTRTQKKIWIQNEWIESYVVYRKIPRKNVLYKIIIKLYIIIHI